MSTKTFLEELEAMTEPNPFAEHERVWECKAALHIERHTYPDMIYLKLIRSLMRSRGYGSEALEWICELADRHNVTIVGHVVPTGTTRPRLTLQQLLSWYRRHGFVVDKFRHMYRYPIITGQSNACGVPHLLA